MRQIEMPAFIEQMNVDVAEQQAERIRVLGLLLGIWPRNSQSIGRPFMNKIFEQPAFCSLLESREQGAVAAAQSFDFRRSRQVSADDATLRGVVRSEHGEWIAVPTAGKGAGRLRIEPPGAFQPRISHCGLRLPSRECVLPA